MISQHGTSEVAIFGRALRSDRGDLSAAAARAFLAVDFAEADKERAQAPSAKAQDGTLAADESDELERCVRVDHVIGLWKSKARKSLNAGKRKVL
ncbi:MAG: hypothetical protein P4L85_02735 [Paludisphaera borealis]|uniref:hypothetical protein n=1 Tax=Paludisphaera borealis TaxID=1387353 RepID=UPI002846EC10|nr:hypothetical protein [Paludisphaera borealis]MDR3618238.1 hypothetical protein [Paludisphaera borealis]